jgi:hypothetical protein
MNVHEKAYNRLSPEHEKPASAKDDAEALMTSASWHFVL